MEPVRIGVHNPTVPSIHPPSPSFSSSTRRALPSAVRAWSFPPPPFRLRLPSRRSCARRLLSRRARYGTWGAVAFVAPRVLKSEHGAFFLFSPGWLLLFFFLSRSLRNRNTKTTRHASRGVRLKNEWGGGLLDLLLLL